MTATVAPAVHAVEQALACFALHALWQVPLLAGAAWIAIRLGRPGVRLAHALWVSTLLLCVVFPLASTVAARRAAVAAMEQADVSISYGSLRDPSLPPLQRESAWRRVLRVHLDPRTGMQPFALALSPRASQMVAVAYAVLFLGFFVHLLRGWLLMRGMVRRATQPLPEPLAEALRAHCLDRGLPVPIAGISSECAGPVLAGALYPVLLLPPGSEANFSSEELDAILAHELAHLRRRDPLLNALCSLALLPVWFHPAAVWTAARIRQTREIACDAEAAGQVRSRRAYAWALLQMAERSGPVKERGVVGMFSTGFFATGLSYNGLRFLNRGGAMEERMQVLMEDDGKGSRKGNAMRWTASVLVAGCALITASMLQVQPALASEQQGSAPGAARETTPRAAGDARGSDAAPALIGAEHASHQLRVARKALAEAGAKASSDEERRKIATAADLLVAAEQELSSQGRAKETAGEGAFRLAPLPDLNFAFDSAHALDAEKFRAQAEAFRAEMENNRAEMDRQRVLAEKFRAQIDTPEFRAHMEQFRKDADAMRARYNSPEFRGRLKQQIESSEAMRARFNSPEMRRAMEQAKEFAKQDAERSLREQGFQTKRTDDGVQIARGDNAPRVHESAEGNAAAAEGKPVPVESRVMANNTITKVQPVYPPEAKEKKIVGAVVLHAIINEEGKVEALTVASSPDPSLSESALTAVRQWVYRPYLLNGKPTAVDTTITVNYSLAP